MQALYTKISWILNTESERPNTYKEILWIQTIQFIEQIALIMPCENQEFFKYDQYSYAFIKICSTMLLQFHTNILVIILILFKFLLIFGALMQKSKDDPLSNWILTYGIFLPSLFYIPEMSHLLFMLKAGEAWVQILSAIGIVILNFFTIISLYLIRNTLFINKAAIKDWTLFSFFIQFLKLVSCILFVFQEQLIIFKINLGCMYFTNIIEIYDLIFNIPFNLFENSLQLSLKMALQIILLIGSNVIFLENFTILNNSQFLIFLVLGTLGYALGEILHQRLILHRLQTFSQKKSGARSLKFQLKFIRGVFKQQDSPLKLIYLSFFFQYHNQSCSQNCRKIYEQKSQKFLKKIQLELLNSNSENNEDDLFIFMLFLYKNEWKSPLLSLMKLKQKILNNQYHTLYFRIKSIALLEKLYVLMKQQYYINQKNYQSKYKLNLRQILLSYHHEKKMLPLFQQLINQKASIFEEIVTGKMNQGKLEIDMQRLGETVIKITSNLEIMVNQSLSNLNLVEVSGNLYIKMLSFYYGVIMNDPMKCQACEHQIYKILLNESLIEGAKFTNRAMHYYKLVVLQVSIVKSQGEIMNSSKLAIGKMLEYESTEENNTIKNIKEIMPQFIAKLHDQMIEEFLNTAQSKYFQEFRQVFALTQQGYVSCLNMQFFNNFSQFDDYVISTILSKEEDQDFILFDPTGRIQGVSRDIFEDLIKPYHNRITINKFINSYFIYAFIPDIFDVIVRYQNKPTDAAYIEERIFYAKDSHESHNLLVQQNIIHQIATDYLNCPLSTTKKLEASASTDKMASLLDLDFGKRVQENIKKNNKQESYIIKFELQLHTIDFQESNLSYYALRILDYNSNQSVDMSQLSSVRSVQSYTEQNTNRQKSIRSPMVVQSPISETLYEQKILMEQKLDQDFQLNSPHQSNGILFVKPIISKPQDDAFLLSVESNSIQQNIKSSQKSNDRSEHNISNLTTNRSIENIYFQNFKGFLEIKYISPYVIRLLQIDIVLFILIFVDIIVSMSLIGNTENLIIQNSKQVTAPLRCNRLFTKAQSLAWLLLLQAFDMTTQSEYFIKQTTNELFKLEEILPANMTEIMNLFQQMESGQIFVAEGLSLDLLYLKNASTNYTKLMNILQVSTISLYKTDFTDTDLSNIKTKDFVHDTLLLRYNMKNYFYVNAQLLEALNQNFNRQLNSYEFTQLIVLTIEFSILSLITLYQAWNWHMYRFELKQVTKIICQISIDDALKEFSKLSHLKFIFSFKQAEVIDWKKQNYFHLMQFNQIEEQLQNSSLSRRNIGNKIKKRNKHIKFTYLLLLFQLIFIGLFFIGSYLLFSSQQTQIKIIQSLSTAYVKFSSSVDVLISSMQIIKTQPLLFEGILQNNIYTSDEIEEFRDGRQIFAIYNYLSQNFSEKLLDVVKDILDSKTIEDGFKVIYTLYNGDICSVLYDGLPFCQLSDIGESEFIQKYGAYYESDDNSEYLSLGIVGIVTRIQKMCNEYFNSEAENNEYLSDLTELQELTRQQDFNNIIFSHFRDSFLAIVTFLNLLLLNLEDVISKQWINLFIYYLTLGVVIECLHVVRFIFSLQRGRSQMYKVKLSVCLLPMNYIFSASTQSSIKRFTN